MVTVQTLLLFQSVDCFVVKEFNGPFGFFDFDAIPGILAEVGFEEVHFDVLVVGVGAVGDDG